MSKLADYAFIILAQMATDQTGTWSAALLAAQTTLPLPTVAKLMKLLCRSEVVAAHRGASGGYRLARQPDQITIADIIEAVDGPIRLTECAGKALGKEDCDCAVSVCPIRQNWAHVNATIRKALTVVSLSDLVPKDAAA